MRARVVFAFTVAWIIVGIAPSVADEVPFKMVPPVSPLIIINHNPRHTGIDLGSDPGETLRSPIDGLVLRIVKESLVKMTWTGIVLKGKDEMGDVAIRILGVAPTVTIGMAIKAGDAIGLAQDPSRDLSGLKPYIHLEVYRNGLLINPTQWAARLWPERAVTNPGTDLDWDALSWRQIGLMAEAGRRHHENNDYSGAIAVYRQALRLPDWEASNTHIHRRIAQAYALLDDYRAAVAAQETYLRLLRLELDYAEGAVPDPELGTIAAVQTPQSLRIYIGHEKDNLESYRLNQPTIIHD